MLAKELGVEVLGASSEAEVRIVLTGNGDDTAHHGIAGEGE
jgi:hypothetical protein